MTKLRWIASSKASALHAAAALAAGREIVDARLAAALAEPAAQLVATLLKSLIPPAEFFHQAIGLAALADEIDPAELATQAAERAIEREISIAKRDALAAALSDLFAAQDEAIPGLRRQLVVRSAPLAEQWEARGSGFLKRVGDLTDRDQIPREVSVALVHPALGGGGGANGADRLVWIEAVLANPHLALPEVVRLGWLIAQAGFAPARARFAFTPVRRARLAAMALAPAALAAAEYVELAHFNTTTFQLALKVWGMPGKDPPLSAEMLLEWWNGPHSWSERVFVLDGLLRRPLC